MTTAEQADAIARNFEPDEGDRVRVLRFADGVVTLLFGPDAAAAAGVADECRGEHPATALARSPDGSVACVVCPADAFDAVRCRLAEELHFYDGLDSPFAADAGLFVFDRRRGAANTLAAFAASLADETV